MARLRGLCVLALACVLLSACAANSGLKRPAKAEESVSAVYAGGPQLARGAVSVRDKATADSFDDALDDYGQTPVMSIADPLEPWNRFWFHFNDIFYVHIAKPVFSAWEAITPHQLRNGLSNFFHNLLFPVRFVNNLLQFRFQEAGVEFGRFIVNSTTSLGLADVTKGKKTVVPVDPDGEDFGQTLGRWGIGNGFYVVWPFLGPSTLRDSVGMVGNWVADPLFHVKPWTVSWGAELGLRFNDLGDVLPLYDDLSGAAVDPYIAMREAYVGYRKIQILR